MAIKQWNISTFLPSLLLRNAIQLLCSEGREGIGRQEDFPAGCCDLFVKDFKDKIIHIHPELDTSYAESDAMTGVTSCLIILDLSDLVDIKEVDKVIGCMSVATYEMEPCPSWLIQTTGEKTGLERFQMPSKEGGTSCLKPGKFRRFPPHPHLSLLREGSAGSGWSSVVEDPRRSGLSGSL